MHKNISAAHIFVINIQTRKYFSSAAPLIVTRASNIEPNEHIWNIGFWMFNRIIKHISDAKGIIKICLPLIRWQLRPGMPGNCHCLKSSSNLVRVFHVILKNIVWSHPWMCLYSLSEFTKTIMFNLMKTLRRPEPRRPGSWSNLLWLRFKPLKPWKKQLIIHVLQ